MKVLLLCTLGLLGYFGIFLGTVIVYDANKLPHRPIGEIDLQGHMYLAPARTCPAVFDAPHGDLRFCWIGL